MITDVEQSTLDIDWFFTDGNHIAFVASGGGKLPLSVANSTDNISILSFYFRQLPTTSDVQINPDLKKVINERQVNESYLADFIYMTERGLYSYDKTSLGNFSDVSYHLVCKPANPFRFADLPSDIAQLLGQTRSTSVSVSSLSVGTIL